MAADSTADESISVLGVAIRDAGRAREIVQVAMRHGFGELVLRIPFAAPFVPRSVVARSVEGTPAERFAHLLGELGPTYIKLGQVLSMRSDLLPPEWIRALTKLQDQAPPISIEEVDVQIEKALGHPKSELFATFDDEPLATASIGQTHLATTKDGARVVVKVQRPGIGTRMRGDLDLLYMAARALESSIDELKLVQPSAIVAEFEKSLLRELSFTSELGHLVTMRRLLDPKRKVIVPEPIPELSSRTVLTMKFFAGKPARELKKGTPEARAAVTELIHAMCKGVLVDGFFHGDPHAGNILVGDDGTVCLLDLGLCGTLSPEQREDLVTLVLATILNDAATVARVLLKLGQPTQRVDIAELKADITRVRSDHVMVSALSDFDSQAFIEEFARAIGKYRVRLAIEYSLLVKAAGTVEGLVRALDPDLDVIPLIRPYVEQVFTERWEPGKVVENALGGATGAASLLRTVPTHVDQILHDFQTGNLQVRPITPKLDQLPDRIHDSATRIAVSIFAASMSIGAGLVVPTGWETPIELLRIALFLAFFVSAISGWVVTWFWHWLGRGLSLRVSPFLNLFRRRR
jgi:ubiquinone biosynthesis protein